MSKKILFFGNERLATGVTTTACTLQDLIAHGYEVAAVVVAQNPIGASRQARQLEVAMVAEEHNIPLIAPDNLKDTATQEALAAYQAEAGVLVAYGKLVPPEILQLFPSGIINVHPSLLPLHRGSTPIESVILEGAHETGVSLMRLVPKMDAGPLYAQESVPLSGRESKQGLVDQLSSIGLELLLQNLPAILDGMAEATTQDESLATYDPHITKQNGIIDWSKPAIQLEREVRAYAGWPRSRTRIGYTDITITASHILEAPDTSEGNSEPGSLWLGDPKQLGFHTGGGVLIIDMLVPSGKKEMSAQAFLAGYKPA